MKPNLKNFRIVAKEINKSEILGPSEDYTVKKRKLFLKELFSNKKSSKVNILKFKKIKLASYLSKYGGDKSMIESATK